MLPDDEIKPTTLAAINSHFSHQADSPMVANPYGISYLLTFSQLILGVSGCISLLGFYVLEPFPPTCHVLRRGV